MKRNLLFLNIVKILILQLLFVNNFIRAEEIKTKEDINKRLEMLEKMEFDLEKITKFDKRKIDDIKKKYDFLKEKYKDIDVEKYENKLEFLNFEKDKYEDILKKIEKNQEKIKEKLENRK